MAAKEIFMGNDFIPAERGVISILAHGFAYGTGCFEGIRGYWNEADRQVYLFHLREHYERLLRSCRILQMSIPYTVDQLIEMSRELVRRNNQREDVYLRPVVYKSDQMIDVGLHNVKDAFILTSVPIGNYARITVLRCCVSSWRRIDDNAIPARAKICGAYVNSSLAKSKALQNGFDETIMLTHDGHVSEGSTENIFLVENGQLITPAPSENILLGITRATVMKLAQRELGISTQERQIDRTELYSADEVFLCGTGAQVTPVIEVDRRPIGDGKVGPITSKLQEIYIDVARGKNPTYRDQWCTPVYSSRP